MTRSFTHGERPHPPRRADRPRRHPRPGPGPRRLRARAGRHPGDPAIHTVRSSWSATPPSATSQQPLHRLGQQLPSTSRKGVSVGQLRGLRGEPGHLPREPRTLPDRPAAHPPPTTWSSSSSRTTTRRPTSRRTARTLETLVAGVRARAAIQVPGHPHRPPLVQRRQRLNDDTALLVNGLGVKPGRRPLGRRRRARFLVDLTAKPRPSSSRSASRAPRRSTSTTRSGTNTAATSVHGATVYAGPRPRRTPRPASGARAPGGGSVDFLRHPSRTRAPPSTAQPDRTTPRSTAGSRRGPAPDPYTGYTRAGWEAAADSLLAAVAEYATENQAPSTTSRCAHELVGQALRRSGGLRPHPAPGRLAARREGPGAVRRRTRRRYGRRLAARRGPQPAPRRGRLDRPRAELHQAAAVGPPGRRCAGSRTTAWLGRRHAHGRNPGPTNSEEFLPVTVGRTSSPRSSATSPRRRRPRSTRAWSGSRSWCVSNSWYTNSPAAPSTTTARRCTCTRCCTWLADDHRLLDLSGGRLSAISPTTPAVRRRQPDAPAAASPTASRRPPRCQLGALAGRTPLSPGETATPGVRRPAFHFLEPGARSRRGAAHPRLARPRRGRVLQGYSGPASQYWASKAFVGLLLPPDQQGVDGAEEEPGPTARADAVAVGHPTGCSRLRLRTGWSACTTTAAMTSAADPYYTRLRYSTATTPSASYDDSVIVGDDPSDGHRAARRRGQLGGVPAHGGWGSAGREPGRRAGSGGGAGPPGGGSGPGTPVRISGMAGRRRSARRTPPRTRPVGLPRCHGPGTALFVALARLRRRATPCPSRNRCPWT